MPDQIHDPLVVKDLAHPSADSTEIWPEWMDTEGLDAEGAEHDNEKLVFKLNFYPIPAVLGLQPCLANCFLLKVCRKLTLLQFANFSAMFWRD